MSEIVTWKVLCYVVPDYKNRAAEELDVVIAAAEERGRRAGIEEAAKKAEERCYNHGPRPVRWCEYCVLAERIRALAPRDSGKEPDFLAAMDAVRDDLKRKGVKINTVELLTELYEGRGHSHEEALRMARGEPDPEDRK